MRIQAALALATTALLAPGAASAFSFPTSFNEAPRGAGTEKPEGQPGAGGIQEGLEAQANIGSGFTRTYGLGFGGRLGYTLRPGVYVGGAISYYQGRSVETPNGSASNSATWVGAEVGYKLFPGNAHWELRPYMFAGPAIVKTATGGIFPVQETTTRFGLQPGLLGAYHFGSAFISAEGRYHLTPSPAAFTLLAGAGLAF